jgi:hypothetical protein
VFTQVYTFYVINTIPKLLDCTGRVLTCCIYNVDISLQVMIVVVLVFIACNGPAKFVHIAWRYQEQRCPSVAFYLMELSNAMEVLASSINFIIYFALRKRFRYVLGQWLGCRRLSGVQQQQPQPQSRVLDEQSCLYTAATSMHTTAL